MGVSAPTFPDGLPGLCFSFWFVCLVCCCCVCVCVLLCCLVLLWFGLLCCFCFLFDIVVVLIVVCFCVFCVFVCRCCVIGFLLCVLFVCVVCVMVLLLVVCFLCFYGHSRWELDILNGGHVKPITLGCSIMLPDLCQAPNNRNWPSGRPQAVRRADAHGLPVGASAKSGPEGRFRPGFPEARGRVDPQNRERN